ncbi:MFS transporter [Luteitalea sp. TBR-22]|uniref:MFS transporter n=1 Tax=Luteitalea sp. TBR-22 TaxID=2802971 RepID=UPI001AF29857|nr:MFS transporter [Luteitalea sp. TBR-22]BCS32945.1 MFS transporter [Luteitalea sp. TBR-22]
MTALQAVLRRLGAALLSRDFRTLWIGAFISTVGTWMQKVAQNWLVLSLTGSAWYLGLDSFLGELPILLFTLVGGVIADRHNRRLLLISSQFVQLTAAALLAGLIWFDMVRIWHVLTLSCLTGLAQAFGGPAYQSLIPSLVPKKDLPNAVALNSIQFNLSRVVGPILAGAALGALGLAACFGLNALSFLAVVAALLLLRVPHVPPASSRPMLTEMRGGLGYVKRNPTLVSLIVVATAQTFLGLPMQTFLPVLAQQEFGQGVDAYTRMMSFSGAGAVVGALGVAWLGRFDGMGTVLLRLQVVFSVLMIAIAWSRLLPLTYLLLFLAGVSTIITTSFVTSLVQLVAPDEMRGRVMSIYMVAFRGGMPLGSLASGALVTSLGLPLALTLNGVLLCLAAAWFLTRRHGVVRI